MQKDNITMAHKASPLGGEAVPDTIIKIVGEDIPDDIKKAAEWYEADAVAIANALYNSLPEGTIARLLAEIMKRYASSIYSGRTSS